jgi:hypothetical protein
MREVPAWKPLGKTTEVIFVGGEKLPVAEELTSGRDSP